MGDRIAQQFGNYRLSKLLGSGGFADVYLGEDRKLGRLAAVKVLHLRLANEDEEESFTEEARIIARLEHPHIVRIYEYGVEGATPYLAMEYAPHGTLRRRHPKGERLSLETIIPYVDQIANALRYAHDNRLIHRDVKPENMLIKQNGQILLSDFGIAAIAHKTASLKTEEFAGTPKYMAPEQIKQHSRRESDQYALAVVVYEWLTGGAPFTGTAQEIAIKHLTAEPPPLRQKLPALPPQVDEVLKQALAKKPEERFASVTEFANELIQACQPIIDGPPAATAGGGEPTPVIPRPTDPYEPPLDLGPVNQPSSGSGATASSGSSISSGSDSKRGGSHTASHAFFRVSPRWRRGAALVLLLLVFLCGIFTGPLLIKLLTPTSATPVSPPPLIFSTQMLDGQVIGISDGSFAFDVKARNGTDPMRHRDGQLKLAAADAYRNGNDRLAEQYWNQAIGQPPDTDDAEVLIYQEDLRVMTLGQPYITLIVAVPLTGRPSAYNVGRDDLQGVYVKQWEFNHRDNAGIQLRLLIANIGDRAVGAPMIAERLQQEALRQDPTIVGVIGWPIQTQTLQSDQALSTICSASIPIVTLSPHDDQSDCSFSVVPTVESEAQRAADYAWRSLSARHVAIIYDAANAYSEKIASDFSADFAAFDPGQYPIVANLPYTLDTGDPLPSLVNAVLKGEPDLIYFAGYPNDLQRVLSTLSKSGSPVKVMGTDLLYQDIHYSGSIQGSHSRLYFTAFASPDKILQPKSTFGPDYAARFDPLHIDSASPYGYDRANSDVMIAYDAISTVCAASAALLAQGKASTPHPVGKQIFTLGEFETALATTRWPGLSGQITFDQQDHFAIDKQVQIIWVDEQGSHEYHTLIPN